MLRYGGSQGAKIWQVVTNASIFRIKGKMEVIYSSEILLPICHGTRHHIA